VIRKLKKKTVGHFAEHFVITRHFVRLCGRHFIRLFFLFILSSDVLLTCVLDVILIVSRTQSISLVINCFYLT